MVMEQQELEKSTTRPAPPSGLPMRSAAVRAAASVSSYGSGSLNSMDLEQLSPLQSVCLEDHMPWEDECSVEEVVNELQHAGSGCCYVSNIVGACFNLNHSGSSLDEACLVSAHREFPAHPSAHAPCCLLSCLTTFLRFAHTIPHPSPALHAALLCRPATTPQHPGRHSFR
jgi:hypothetical protein